MAGPKPLVVGRQAARVARGSTADALGARRTAHPRRYSSARGARTA